MLMKQFDLKNLFVRTCLALVSLLILFSSGAQSVEITANRPNYLQIRNENTIIVDLKDVGDDTLILHCSSPNAVELNFTVNALESYHGKVKT